MWLASSSGKTLIRHHLGSELHIQISLATVYFISDLLSLSKHLIWKCRNSWKNSIIRITMTGVLGTIPSILTWTVLLYSSRPCTYQFIEVCHALHKIKEYVSFNYDTLFDIWLIIYLIADCIWYRYFCNATIYGNKLWV